MILVVGGGNFGARALHQLCRVDRVLVVDPNEGCPARNYVKCVVRGLEEFLEFEKCSTAFLASDGARVLAVLFERGIKPRYVVPTAPMHVAYEALKNILLKHGFAVKPFHEITQIAAELRELGVETYLDSFRGMLVASYMPFDMKCSVPCKQPMKCPVTGKIKPLPLYMAFNSILQKHFERFLVIRSILLAESVGGYDPEALYSFTSTLLNNVTKSVMAIATACSCHGIANFFTYERV
jgi:hypothetical protein